ncbi:hypothetical protein [Rhodopseudomonas palustris]|nr:hypothetical protein [Rhodopseudomonas palustris]
MSDDLLLRRVDHPHAENSFHVIWRGITIGAIGLQQGAGQRRF